MPFRCAHAVRTIGKSQAVTLTALCIRNSFSATYGPDRECRWPPRRHVAAIQSGDAISAVGRQRAGCIESFGPSLIDGWPNDGSLLVAKESFFAGVRIQGTATPSSCKAVSLSP